MRRVTVQLELTELERLDRLAAERGVSRAGAVRLLVAQAAPPSQEPLTREEAFALVVDKARSGHWGAMQYLARRRRAGE